MSKRGTCWQGYEQKGMKKKGNKMVPNCVPAGMKTGGLITVSGYTPVLGNNEFGYPSGGIMVRKGGKA